MDRVAVMYGGQMVETGDVDEIFYDPKHPYTLTFSMPDLTTGTEIELLAIPGTPPDLLHPPKGDAFVDRSQFALDIDLDTTTVVSSIANITVKPWLLDDRAPSVEPPEMVKNVCVICQITLINHNR